MKHKKLDDLTFINNSVRKYILPVFIALAVILFTGLGHTGLFDVDEAIFAEASYEMIETGDYVTPTYNGEPRYHKPPFIYWLQAFSMETLGKSAFSARLPSAIFGFLTLVVFFIFLESMTRNMRFALTATAILGLNLSYYLVSHAATADMALNFFILITTLSFLAMLYAKERHGFAPIIGGFLLAAAFLSKGPVAVMVPGIVIGVATFLKPDIWENLKRINPIYALMALIIGISPWIYLTIEAKGLDFFKEFWLVHNIGRFTNAMGNTHTTSKAYYIFVVMFGLFPWILLFPSAFNWVRKNFIARLRSNEAITVLPALGLVWFVFVIFFFSFSQTKLPHYILPAYAGFALLLAGRLEDMWKAPVCRLNMLWMLPYILLFSSLFIILPYAPDIALGKIENLPITLQKFMHWLQNNGVEIKELEPQKAAVWLQEIAIPKGVKLMGVIFALGSIFGMWIIMEKQRKGVAILAASTGLALLLATYTLVPSAYNFLQKELHTIGEKIEATYKDGESTVYFVAIHQPSVRFVSGKPFENIGRPSNAPANNTHSFYVFKLENLSAMREKLVNTQFIEYCEGGYCLIESNRK